MLSHFFVFLQSYSRDLSPIITKMDEHMKDNHMKEHKFSEFEFLPETTDRTSKQLNAGEGQNQNSFLWLYTCINRNAFTHSASEELVFRLRI